VTILPAPLDSLPDEDLATVLDYFEPIELSAGTRLFDAGDAGDGCYLVDAGSVRLDVPFDEVDTDATLAYVEPGQLLGELALLDGAPRSAHATAESDVSARHLSSKNLDRLVEDHPRLAAVLLRTLGRDVARKLRHTNGQLAEHLAGEGRDHEVDRMVEAAAAAQAAFAGWDEERVDALLGDLAQRIAARAEEFATAAVEVTRLGNVPDKTVKNVMASLGVYGSFAGHAANGSLGPASSRGVTELAAPAGVIFGIIPVTNPVATAVYKALIALKGRNALILSFHRVCLPLGESFAAAVSEVLEAHDAPTDLVQCVRARSSRQRTARFMSHPGVSLVLATGGPGMVRAAYRSGTPAIGVGPGNAPTWIAADAELDAAAAAIVASKSFDNGLICGAEHNLVVQASVVDRFCEALEAAGAAVLDDDETERFLAAAVADDGRSFRPELNGQGAQVVAGLLGIERDHPIRVLVVPCEPDLDHPMTSEKMAPFLSLFTVDDDAAALELCQALIGKMGTGHTAIVHTTDPARGQRFAEVMPASRILVNSPGSQGVCGLTTGLEPALTLGCGTFGGTSTTDNVTWRNLVNVKRLATYQEPSDGPA
jgi:acyl-CoA reductase-like NAD-dependent aldehyde dehydrogenase